MHREERNPVQRGAAGTRCEAGGARLWATILTAIVAALALFLFWPEAQDMPGERTAPTAETRMVHEHTAAEVTEEADLYTCGMHPQVLSEEPGQCPICRMKLTPVKVEQSEGAKRSGQAARAEQGERKVKYWRAPMDPTYISDRPGKSPMGMDLIPVYEDEVEESGPVVRISPVVVQNMGVRTALVTRSRLARTIRTVGRIDYDETLVRDVTTKFDGWLEELYADYTGQYVERGAPLFTVYSPQLYSSQEEYLLALRNRDAVRADVLPQARPEMRPLIESSRLRLQLFDISDEQIAELEKRGEPSKTLTILSPHTGIIIDKNARDGMHITPGTKLYTIADLVRVWIYVDIFENEVPFVKLGQDAVMELSYLPGQVFHGKVIYVYPFVDTKTRTVKVRLEFENPHLELKPGMFADVRIETDLGKDGLVVPRSAVIDTGRRQVAFVALGEGRFEPREITMGVELGDDDIEVVRGLREGEPVVVSGQFLLDSESKLREAILKMIEQKRVTTDVVKAPGKIDAERDQAAHGRGLEAEAGAIGTAARDGERPGRETERGHAAGAPSSLPELAAETEGVIDNYLELHGLLARDATRQFREAAARLDSPLGRLEAAAAAVEGAAPEAVLQLTRNARGVVERMRSASPDAIRALFIELSDDVIGIIGAVGTEDIGRDLHAFHCPMAGADWIQEATEPANPYYGFSMLRCGDPIELTGKRGTGE